MELLMGCLAHKWHKTFFFSLLLVPVVAIFILPENLGASLENTGKRVDVKKGVVAFVEVSSEEPLNLYIMYPTQYSKYQSTGSLDGVIDFQDITWLIYPVPAMLEDQTLFFVSEGSPDIDIRYENIQERIDSLYSGEEKLRAGMEVRLKAGVNMIRLTPLLPDLKIRLDFTGNARFAIAETIDFARFRRGLKTFDELYNESDLKGSGDGYDFTTSNFEDLYLLVSNPDPIRVRTIIHATKASAESGC